jgi:hypothetical protein
MRLSPIQMNMTSGEIAPRLFGRSDMAKYWNSLETLENFIILPYGGVTRRDGLHYVVAQKDETRKARMIRFQFSTEQAYIIEAGHEYMRFYMNHGQILEEADSGTVLLLHMNGEDGSQTFTDSSQSVHTVTAHSTAQIDTDQSKLGGASGLFDEAVDSYLTVPDHADFDFSADNTFTIETWIRVNEGTTPNSCDVGYIFEQKTDDDNLAHIIVQSDGHIEFVVINATNTQTLSTPALAVTPETWHHVRVVGDGTNYYIFIDGTIRDQAAITQSMQDFTGLIYIGKGTSGYDGWMDEFRISKVARSTANFVPQIIEYPITGTPYEIATPYTESALPKLKYFQSFDTMYIFHPDYAWRKLTRTGHAAWSLDIIEHKNGPWLEEKTDISFTPSEATGDITLTSSAAFFAAGHVNALLKLKHGDIWGQVKITAVTNSTTATATVVENLGSGSQSIEYQEIPWVRVGVMEITPSARTGNITLTTSLSFFHSGQIGILLRFSDGVCRITAVTNSTHAYATVLDGFSTASPTIGFDRGEWLAIENDILFTSSGATGNITITADSDYFHSSQEGNYLRLNMGGIWGLVKITNYTSPTAISAAVIDDLAIPTGSTSYQEGAWSGVRGYPSSGCFNEESLVAIANDNQPQTVWGSQKGDYENFEVGTEDDDAFIYTIPASNRILYPGTLRNLVLVTGDGTYSMTGGSDDYICPTNVKVKPGLSIGAADISAIHVANSLLFWQKGALKLRELAIDPVSYYGDSYLAPDITLLADHITTGGIKYSAWQQEPDSVLWNVRADGVMPTMTYMRPEEVIGWARQITDGYVESIATIPDPTDTFNEVWVSVKRVVDGDTHRYIEYMDSDMMVDSGITYSGGEVASVSGLDHLEGKTVDIVADGVEYDRKIVVDGTVAIDPPASEIQVGLPFTSKLVTMKPVINSEKGTTAGLPKKWAEVYVSLHETSGLTINDEEINFRPAGVALGEPIPLFTGDKQVSQLGWDEGRVTIEHKQSLPCTVLGIFGKLEVG